MAITTSLILLLPDVPRHGQRQPIANALRGRIAQQALRLADVDQAVAHVADAKVAVDGLGALRMRVAWQQVAVNSCAYNSLTLVRSPTATLYTWFTASGFRVGVTCRLACTTLAMKQKSRLISLSPLIYRLPRYQACNPFGDDGDVGTFGVLPGAEYVEVAQANGVETIAAGKHVGIQLVHVFGDGVGAERFADGVFDLGQAGGGAIGASAGGIGEAFDALPCVGVARGHQHVGKVGNVGRVGGDGVLQAARHAAQGGLVQDVIDAFAGGLAVGQCADVALDDLEVGPLLGGGEGLHLGQVALVAGGKVVEPDDARAQLEQGFKQVAANEAGHAGDEPGARDGEQPGLQGLVGDGSWHFYQF